MGMPQRKGKKGGVSGKGSAAKDHNVLQQQTTAGDDSSGSENQVAAEERRLKGSRGDMDQKGRSAFARAADLEESDDEEPQVWTGLPGPSGNPTADQERIREEKERKRAKRGRERSRGNRQDAIYKQKKGAKRASLSSFLQSFSGGELRSRLSSWFMYLLVAAAILGIFVLRALEEYYGLDDDISGEERLQHLTVLGLEDGATENDIRRSYRTLSIRWHPDRNANCGTNCQQRFQEVAAAYEYLMRKQRKAKVDEEGEESGEAAEGEDAAGLKMTSQGIVDFSGLGPNDVFPPTTDTKNVWTVMVHQDKDEWSQSVYEMWQESSRTLGKYVKFGVITIRGRHGKDALKKLPINVKIFPAILLMTAGMHPEQYPQISRPSVESINHFIADSFPSNIDVVRSATALRSWLASSSSSFQPLAVQYKAVIIPSAASSSSPSLLVKHAAFSNRQTFSFCFLANARSVLTNQKEELLTVLKNPPTWLAQVAPESAVAKALKLPVQLEELREEDLITNSNVFLFMDEGRGISRAQATLHTLRSKLLNPATAISLAIDGFKEVIQPLLYQQNNASLCKGSLQRRVFCLVAVEPAEVKTEGSIPGVGKTLDLARIKSLLKVSKAKYLKENPRKDLEAIWERAIQKAKDHERTHQPKGQEEEYSGISTKEPDDLHIEQPDDMEEEIIHIQVVRVSIGTPIAVPSLPALPHDNMFTKLMREELNDAPLFLLDLESSRVAALPPLFVGDEGSSSESTESFYKRLYEVLDELQNSSDDDEEARLSFSALPEYCTGKDFARKCLASDQRSWLWGLLTGWSFLQIGFIAAVGAATFMFWNKMTAEMFLVSMLLLSLAVGAYSTIQPLLPHLFGDK